MMTDPLPPLHGWGVDPLTPFLHWGVQAPYLAEPPDFSCRARVVAVRTKVPFASTKRGGIVHRHNGVAAIISGATARLGARFLCGDRAHDVMVMASADASGGACERCEDVAAGPCVYRCFTADGSLVYIGSTSTRLKRLKIHETQSGWWPEVADVKTDRFPTIFEARAAERLAIIAEAPAYNKQYRRPA